MLKKSDKAISRTFPLTTSDEIAEVCKLSGRAPSPFHKTKEETKINMEIMTTEQAKNKLE